MAIKVYKEGNKFSLTIIDNLKDIKILRKLIEIWLEDMGIEEFKVMSVKLCVDEAVYNGIIHAYKGETKKKIVDVFMEKVKNDVKILIRDYGKKDWYKKYKKADNMTGTSRHDPAPSHGRGIIIMQKLSESFKIVNSPKTGTQVSMAIDLASNKIII